MGRTYKDKVDRKHSRKNLHKKKKFNKKELKREDVSSDSSYNKVALAYEDEDNFEKFSRKK